MLTMMIPLNTPEQIKQYQEKMKSGKAIKYNGLKCTITEVVAHGDTGTALCTQIKKYSDEQEIGGKQQLTDERIHLTKEDRKQFAEGIKTVNAIQFLIIKDIIAECEDRLTAQDLKFIHSHLGRRAERLLKNVLTETQEGWHFSEWLKEAQAALDNTPDLTP